MYERITLDNLERYDAKLKGWLGKKLAPAGSTAPMALTEKAGAVACWPVGGTELRPAVDFMFTETPPASGDKSPTNPSMIAGVSQFNVVHCGKNLIKQPYYHSSGREINGITFIVSSDGTITCTGEATDYAGFTLCDYATFFLAPGTYFLSGCPSGGGSRTYSLDVYGVTSGHTLARDYGNGAVFTVSAYDRCNVYISIKTGYDCGDGITFNPPQLLLGTSASAYEPYSGNDYTVQLGSTYYGGSIDLASGVMTVTWYGCIFDGTETVMDTSTETQKMYRLPVSYYSKVWNQCSCTHYPAGNVDGSCYVRATFDTGFVIRDNSFTSGTNLQDWVAQQYTNGTPLTVVYQLLTPLTVQLSLIQIYSLSQVDKYTPRINTVYTDASAIQVGYVKSPIREEFELTQAIVAQGGEV